MCLILWLQTNIKPGCNYLWCRTHELGEINPTPFVPFSSWLLQDVASVSCLGFHSSEQGLGTPFICSYTFLYRGNPFCGEGPRGIPSGQSRVRSCGCPCCSASLCCWEAPGAGHGQVSGAGIAARAAWEERRLSKTGHGQHTGGVSGSAGVEANLVCRRFYKVRK